MSNATSASHDLTALRLYFPSGSRATRTRFWHHLNAPALAQHLLAVAKRANLQQALLHHVDAGYLRGERMSHHHPEVHSMRHPQCLELLDTEERLRAFMREHAEELIKVRAVLFRCQLPLEENAGPAAR